MSAEPEVSGVTSPSSIDISSVFSPASGPMYDLPTELWYYITNLLSSPELWELRGINHFFREAAYDRRFKVMALHLGNLENMGPMDDLFYLAPDRTCRARELHLQFGEVGDRRAQSSTMSPFSAPIAACKKMVSKVQNYLLKPRVSVEAVNTSRTSLRVLLAMSPKFSRPSKTSNKYSSRGRTMKMQDYASIASLKSLCYQPLFSRTTQISPLSLLKSGITNNFFGYLPHSQRSPDFLTSKKSVFQSGIKDLVVPFLNTHRETLSSLHLLADGYFSGLDLSFLHFLAPIPHLRMLKLYLLVCMPSAAQNIEALLKKHANTIESLILSVVEFNNTDASPPYSKLSMLLAPLPSLKHLEIAGEFCYLRGSTTRSLPALVHYVSYYRDTLHSLRIFGKMILYTDIERLASVTWPKLVSLDLQLPTCHPEFFDSLAKGFPSLQEVSLSVYFFQGSTVPSEGLSENKNRTAFLTNLARRSYPTSHLGHILIKFPDITEQPQRHERNTTRTAQIDWLTHLYDVLFEAFPRLISVNDIPRSRLKSYITYKRKREAMEKAKREEAALALQVLGPLL
ncbi:hypothetical protein CPB83DRAFT_923342 [Crepidotus variabilis]|uniref:F-box domain-containing protein n=1 Tax=Crepidotus variabilis TaxID=179855 RepID=A0A9P6JRQ5_9AGAR|nr:hypothetical protein CPB83DRAFT_923342 [Crepidotus variabilis]